MNHANHFVRVFGCLTSRAEEATRAMDKFIDSAPEIPLPDRGLSAVDFYRKRHQ
jgi:hypothetical protein